MKLNKIYKQYICPNPPLHIFLKNLFFAPIQIQLDLSLDRFPSSTSRSISTCKIFPHPLRDSWRVVLNPSAPDAADFENASNNNWSNTTSNSWEFTDFGHLCDDMHVLNVRDDTVTYRVRIKAWIGKITMRIQFIIFLIFVP